MTSPSDPNLPGDQDPRPAPPLAEQRPHSVTHHGVTLEDPWHWLRDPGYPTVEDPDILRHLKAENAYFEAAMEPHRVLVETIFEEIKGRQQPDLSSVPWRRGGWFYQWSYPITEGGEGSQYRMWRRWPADAPEARNAPTADARIILDEPELANDVEYFRLGSVSVSNGGGLLAYSADTTGSERFRMVVKDLESGELLEDAIENTTGNAVWAADDASFFYAVVDENWRPWQVRRHVLEQPVDRDAVVYEEQDSGFFTGVIPSTSRSTSSSAPATT